MDTSELISSSPEIRLKRTRSLLQLTLLATARIQMFDLEILEDATEQKSLSQTGVPPETYQPWRACVARDAGAGCEDALD
jgi:hypothetical protein